MSVIGTSNKKVGERESYTVIQKLKLKREMLIAQEAFEEHIGYDKMVRRYLKGLADIRRYVANEDISVEYQCSCPPMKFEWDR